MTEAEWLDATDPEPMLEVLRNTAHGDSQLRWFAMACVGQYHMSQDREQFVTRIITGISNRDTQVAVEMTERGLTVEITAEAGRAGDAGEVSSHAIARVAANLAADLASESAFSAAELRGTTDESAQETAQLIARVLERKKQADLLRCIAGNPFRPPAPVNSHWLTWNNSAIAAMAQSIHDERAFERLPILADALEEAGCRDAVVLRHCRDGGLHERGCWVIGWVLGKEQAHT